LSQFGSAHPSGTNVTLADGSRKHLSPYRVEPLVFHPMGGQNHGRTLVFPERAKADLSAATTLAALEWDVAALPLSATPAHQKSCVDPDVVWVLRRGTLSYVLLAKRVSGAVS
jgi:hypothetical protein